MISGARYHLVATYSVRNPVWSWAGSATRASPKSQICRKLIKKKLTIWKIKLYKNIVNNFIFYISLLKCIGILLKILKVYAKLHFTILVSKPGVGKLRAAGQMQPSKVKICGLWAPFQPQIYVFYSIKIIFFVIKTYNLAFKSINNLY